MTFLKPPVRPTSYGTGPVSSRLKMKKMLRQKNFITSEIFCIYSICNKIIKKASQIAQLLGTASQHPAQRVQKWDRKRILFSLKFFVKIVFAWNS